LHISFLSEKVGLGLRVEEEVLPADVEIRSRGDAIYYLRLPDGVVDSASLGQIRHEGRMQRMA